MRIKPWGVRGSIPTPGPATIRYGGNTSCFEVLGQNDECIILDAGTGIRLLGIDLMKRGKKPLPPIYLFISHTHWDHIQGFPFFTPCYVHGSEIHIKGPMHYSENKSLQEVFDLQMRYEYFPISNEQLAAKIDYESIAETTLQVGSIQVRTQFMNHPILCLGTRLTENGRSAVYTGDHEPFRNIFIAKKDPSKGNTQDPMFKEVDQQVNDANQRFIDFIRGTNVLVVDCQYTPEEYETSRRGWGHSSWAHCLNWMREGQVERMVLTHHDPNRSDQALDEMLIAIRTKAKELGLDPQKISMAMEGIEIDV